MKLNFLTSVAPFAFDSTASKDKKAAETEHIALKWTGKNIFSILLFCILCMVFGMCLNHFNDMDLPP